MRLKDNKIIILLIFLTSSILIFGFNYLYGNNRKPSPYFMSDKFIAFESNNNNHSLDFLNMNENISVVAEIKNSKDVAIYDPVMKYYMGSTKIINPALFRYFSKEDYQNKNNVSILIYPVIDFVEGKISEYDKKEVEDNYHTEIINMFDVQSYIANDGKVDVVRNLFTIKPENISTLYIDSSDGKSLKSVAESLEKIGYKRKEIKMYDKLTLRDLIKTYPEYKVYAQFITNSTVMAVAMYAISLWMFLNKYKKFVIISANFGAKLKDIMKMFIEKALGYSFITCAISTALTYGYLAIINENEIAIYLILQLQIILIILTVILSALRAKLSYNEFEKEVLYDKR